jgi:Mn2+/Fe2+ NRAMP family transporter
VIQRKRFLLRTLAPGLLVAATGVGAGDLATGAFSGSAIGPAILWAVLIGALLKFVLSEGLARFQLQTGQTLLEGALLRTPVPLRYLFLLYLIPWSWFVGSALISACGLTANAMLPISDDPLIGKVVWGAAHSLLGLVLVRRGGYELFGRMMSVAVGIMFVTVVWTALALGFDSGEVLRGLFIPTIPEASGEGLTWTVALIGGVGGTLTLLCYGYWIREEGRFDPSALKLCRIDLAVGFSVTAVFGIAMVLIGSRIETSGRGSGLIVSLAEELGGELGSGARWAFLIGAWGAVFSSLVGVWQAVPYIFADFWRLRRGQAGDSVSEVDASARPYRLYMYALALIPLLGLFGSFKQAQKAYSVVGAAFLPLLALSLLWLNRKAVVGEAQANRMPSILSLVAILAFFVLAGWIKLAGSN